MLHRICIPTATRRMDKTNCPNLLTEKSGHAPSMTHCPICGYDRRDPGNQWAQKPLSVRLEQVKNQWLNLGPQQKLMLDNFILSADWMEERLKELEAK